MALDRETATEVAVSVGGVALFVFALIIVGVLFYHRGFSTTGGLAMVGLMALFVVVFTAIGWWLSGRQS